jgi:acyl CoA:acetate/3-ketoacid CoA transferase
MNKIIGLDEAVELVPDQGARLALGGITLHQRPLSFVLTMMDRFRNRGAPADLSLLAFTAGLESDLLAGEGMPSQVRTCYFGL